jgi:hypothetical protein
MTRIYVYMYEYIEQVAMKCALYPHTHTAIGAKNINLREIVLGIIFVGQLFGV